MFLNESIQNRHFLCRKIIEEFISNLKFILAFFFLLKNMKNYKSLQNRDTDYHYIKDWGGGGGIFFPVSI